MRFLDQPTAIEKQQRLYAKKAVVTLFYPHENLSPPDKMSCMIMYPTCGSKNGKFKLKQTSFLVIFYPSMILYPLCFMIFHPFHDINCALDFSITITEWEFCRNRSDCSSKKKNLRQDKCDLAPNWPLLSKVSPSFIY